MASKSSARSEARRARKRERAELEQASVEQEAPSLVELRSLSRGDLVAAAFVTALAFALYGATACRSFFVGDCPEIAAAISVFGIPHPPGYPLFTLVSALLARLVPVTDAAFAANLVTGLYGACAVGLCVTLVRRLSLSMPAALFAAVGFAVGRTFWSQCVASEVYSFDMLIFLGVLNLFALTAQRRTRALWIVSGTVVGLWLGHRTVNLIYLPSALLFFAALRGFKGFVERKALLAWAAGAAIVAGVVPYLYLPIVSSFEPAIDIGDPETWERFETVISGDPYKRHFEGNTADKAFYRYGQYFGGLLVETGAAALLALAAAYLLGFGAAARGTIDRALSRSMIVMWATNLAFIAIYNILDINVYFLPSFIAIAVLGALGAEHFLRRLSHPKLGFALVALALVGLFANRSVNDLSKYSITRCFAEDLFSSIPKDGVFFVNGDTSIHSSWYLQGVEGRSPDVVVISIGHLVPWYVEQLHERHPDVDWPPYEEGMGQFEYARLVMERVIGQRPICMSPSVDPTQFLQRSSVVGDYVPRGLVREFLKIGASWNPRERGEWNLAFFEGAIERLGEIPEEVDMDTRSTLVQYSLALYQSAGMLEQVRRYDLAVDALEACLLFRPDVHERMIYEDAKKGLGIETPRNRFGQKARKRIQEIRDAGLDVPPADQDD